MPRRGHPRSAGVWWGCPVPSIALPTPPQAPARAPFPLIATIAPVVVSLALFLLTSSPFTLLFALLGPLVAIASLVDSRRGNTRRSREAHAAFEATVRRTRESIDTEHDRERDAAESAAPSFSRLLGNGHRDPERWRARGGDALPVRVGSGTLVSGLDLAPTLSDDPSLLELLEHATRLPDAPVSVDARLGIGFCGPLLLAHAAARAVTLRLAFALGPGDVTIRAATDWLWLRDLPHRVELSSEVPGVEFVSGDDTIVVAVAATADTLPSSCRVVVSLTAPAGILSHPEAPDVRDLVPEFASLEQAVAFSRRLALAAEQDGLGASAGLPESVTFSSIGRVGGGVFGCAIGVGAAGPVILDLVRDGPHLLVGGTTGSGKSELLVTLALALASTRSPLEVNFLLVDFKGGSAFAPLAVLPHCAGVVTDLDEREAGRALESLRAELRRREAALARAAVKDVAELAPGVLPRLVIVVDEFAAMVSELPGLHELFADIAARGRSLGLHLVLCTQRPSGVIRDAVLANCSLRICLRVNNPADSAAVVGVPDASRLPRTPGRALAAVAGERPTIVQLALAGPADAREVAAVWRDREWELHRPWLDPLPPRLPFSALPALLGGDADADEIAVPIGLFDLPERQEQPVAVYRPRQHGNLLVLGGAGSGKSGALAAIGSAGNAQLIPADIEGAWDVVFGTLAAVRAGQRTVPLLLVDDLDTLCSRFTIDYQQAFVELLAAVLQEGPSAGVRVVAAARRLGWNAISALCDSRILLRIPDRADYLLAGGEPGLHDPTLPPGGGQWQAKRIQFVLADPLSPAPRPVTPPVAERLDGSFAVVAAAPGQLGDLLRTLGSDLKVVELDSAADGLETASGGRRTVIIGDPDVWQARWGLLPRLRSRLPVLVHGCSTSEFRAVTRLAELPPPLENPRQTAWLVPGDGPVERVALPMPKQG
nr:FtsK/SpoIIIE domain-containing protein [Cryobacterium sp. BB736]